MDHWAGKPLMFDNNERIAATRVDPRIYSSIDRLEAYRTGVFDDDPAFNARLDRSIH
jgi:hypothetical protein